jgi:hypothetical protein
VTKILTPPQAEPILEVARELLPPGMELIVVDPGKPEFYDKAATPTITWARRAPASATSSSGPRRSSSSSS